MEGNTITLKAENQDEIVFWLDAPLVDLARPVLVVKPDGKTLTFNSQPNVEAFCASLEERADPQLAGPLRIAVDLRK